MVFQLTKRLAFPDPHWGDPDGLLAIGGDLSVDRLILAYSTVSFPGMPSARKSSNGGARCSVSSSFGRDSHLPFHAHANEQE